MSSQEHFYNIDLNWKEGRTGILSSPKLSETIEVVTPPEFEGGVEGKWSPEHLFVASVSSCLMTTFAAIAQYSKLPYEALNIKATGKIAKNEDGKFVISEITLKPELMITDEKFSDKAHRILEKAETNCLISRSIKSEIIFEPNVLIGTLN
jgi:peroxiredoxin-like protein